MHASWSAATGFLLATLLVVGGLMAAAALLGVRARRRPPTALQTYECGEEPDGVAWIRFHPRYYVIALVFVLFDVETVFLLPWALTIESLGALAIVEMFAFAGILLLGWLYAYRKGALRWQ